MIGCSSSCCRHFDLLVDFFRFGFSSSQSSHNRNVIGTVSYRKSTPEVIFNKIYSENPFLLLKTSPEVSLKAATPKNPYRDRFTLKNSSKLLQRCLFKKFNPSGRLYWIYSKNPFFSPQNPSICVYKACYSRVYP